MSKAGKASEGGVTSIGREHPLPENIPHLTSPGPNGTTNPINSGANGGSLSGASGGSFPGASSGSPVKESSFLYRETSVDEPSTLSPKNPGSPENKETVSPPAKEGVDVRRQD